MLTALTVDGEPRFSATTRPGHGHGVAPLAARAQGHQRCRRPTPGLRATFFAEEVGDWVLASAPHHHGWRGCSLVFLLCLSRALLFFFVYGLP